MPEGHTVHRTALEFRKNFVGQEIVVESPQGRFAGAAIELSGRQLLGADAIGKQLFLAFDADLTVRIHLGIYGKWRFESYERAIPAPVGAVRARFIAATRFADLRGPTACELLHPEQVAAAKATLGPDPLAPDTEAEGERFLRNVQKSRSAIGLLLMNQNVIAGVGNVYRAELLFRSQVNPHVPGNQLSVETVQNIWDDSVRLLRVGVKKGVMITRDEYLKGRLPLKSERNFVYKRENLPCRICGSKIILELMATRKLYWCPTCQP